MPCVFARNSGFTVVELITVIVLVGILAAVAAPRFFDRGIFDSRGFHDQAIAALRYAQKSAIAQHRFVCVAITANNITLTQGATNACGSPLADPSGAASYSISAPSDVTIGAASFSFDSLGTPSAAQSIAVSGAATITVERETGYVH